jgi:hypothetical protein
LRDVRLLQRNTWRAWFNATLDVRVLEHPRGTGMLCVGVVVCV